MYKVFIIFILVTSLRAQEVGEACFEAYVKPYLPDLKRGCSIYSYMSDMAVVNDFIKRGQIPIETQVKLFECKDDVVVYYKKHYSTHSAPNLGMKIYLKKLQSKFENTNGRTLMYQHSGQEWILLFEDDAKGFIQEYSERYPKSKKSLEKLKREGQLQCIGRYFIETIINEETAKKVCI